MFAMTFLSGLGAVGLGLLMLVFAVGFLVWMGTLLRTNLLLYCLVSDEMIAGFCTVLECGFELLGALLAAA